MISFPIRRGSLPERCLRLSCRSRDPSARASAFGAEKESPRPNADAARRSPAVLAPWTGRPAGQVGGIVTPAAECELSRSFGVLD